MNIEATENSLRLHTELLIARLDQARAVRRALDSNGKMDFEVHIPSCHPEQMAVKSRRQSELVRACQEVRGEFHKQNCTANGFKLHNNTMYVFLRIPDSNILLGICGSDAFTAWAVGSEFTVYNFAGSFGIYSKGSMPGGHFCDPN